MGITRPDWLLSREDIDKAISTSKSKTVFTALYETKSMKFNLYKPYKLDMQNKIQPFERAEIYIVWQGEGEFVQNGVRTAVKKGDVIFVEPRAIHNYEKFSDDLELLLIMYDEAE